MTKMVTLKLPKKDVESFLRVVEDMRFIQSAEKGNEEIAKGDFKTLEHARKKYTYHQ
ncbi:MAG: hypothetical protein HYY37_03665 [Candidatus Aenigmarchaeota archaeon]|nr:hypothetical protein [Candidatus Aenigmarchaeota archaeon]